MAPTERDDVREAIEEYKVGALHILIEETTKAASEGYDKGRREAIDELKSWLCEPLFSVTGRRLRRDALANKLDRMGARE